MPPSAAPVTEVTPKTTASSSSGRLLKKPKSAAPMVWRSPAKSAPASPAMPAERPNRPTRNQRMSRPSVPQAAGLSRMAISIRPTTPRRSSSSAHATATKNTAITKT